MSFWRIAAIVFFICEGLILLGLTIVALPLVAGIAALGCALALIVER